MQTRGLQTLEQIRSFLEGNEPLEFERPGRQAAYAFISQTLQRFDYARMGRADKGLIRRYLFKLSGLLEPPTLQVHNSSGAMNDTSALE